VATYDLAPRINEFRLGRLESPDKRGGVVGLGLAGVDLDTACPELEEEDGACSWLQDRRNLLGAGGRSLGSRRSGEASHNGKSGDQGTCYRYMNHG
jgi:hypothetical protein